MIFFQLQNCRLINFKCFNFFICRGSHNRKKSLISNTDFSNLENDFLEICLLETVISNLILKNPWGLPGPPGVCMGLCVW